MILFGALSAGMETWKHIYCVGQIDMLLHQHFPTPSVLAQKYVLQFDLSPFPSKMIELKALPLPIQPIAMHTSNQLHTKVTNFYPCQLCIAVCILGPFAIRSLNLEFEMIERLPVITGPHG